MKTWKFLNLHSKEGQKINDSFFTEYKNFSDVPKTPQFTMVKETMFASHYDDSILNELHKCVRVMPHH
jgi:hypothetical protein